MTDHSTRTFDICPQAILGLPDSTLADTTIQAYLQAEYRIHAEMPFSLKVGEVSPALLQLYGITATRSAAFVTPYNPLGHLLSERENLLRLGELETRLEAEGCPWFAAEGLDPEGEWPPEKGVLIMGVTQDQAQDWGRRFRQNAVLWCDPQGSVSLWLLV